MKNNKAWAMLLIVVLIFLSRTPADTNNNSNVDISTLIDSGVAFSGQNKYVKSTALSSEDVRVLRLNGESKDLGYVSLDLGTLSTTPNVEYKFYFFMNTSASDSYYVNVQEYTAPVQDAVDNVIGYGCEKDKDLRFWVLNSNSQVQTNYTNSISLDANSAKDISIKLKVNSDKCYGNPDAPESKENVVCLLYNANAISSIDSFASYSASPSSISTSSDAVGKSVKCFKFPVLENLDVVEIPLTLNAGSTEPTSEHNITVMVDDIGFDLNAETLEEIWGYVDEDQNELGITAQALGYIRLS